ncbi:hypothetical protein AB9F45_35700, partial [Rhizobium leguminosarum]
MSQWRLSKVAAPKAAGPLPAPNRGSRMGEPRLRYVQLGTMAGDEIAIRGDMLRSTGLEMIGRGIGSVAVTDLVAGAGELLAVALQA